MESKRKIFTYIFVNKRWIFLGILTTFITTLLEVPFPFIVRIVIDKIILNSQKELLPFIILLLGALLPLKILFPFLQKYYLSKLVRKSGFVIRQVIMNRLIHLKLDMYNKKGPGYFSSRIFEDCDTLIGNIYNTLIPMLQYILILVISLASMIYIKWTLALIPVVLIPIYIFINISMGKELRNKNADLAEKRARFFETFNDIIQSILSVRIRTLETLQRLNFLQKDKNYLRQTINLFKTQSILEAFNSFFSISVPSIVLVVGIILILKNNMSLGDYVAFSSFLGFFLGAVKFFFSTNVNFQRLRVAFNRITEIFEWPISHEFNQKRLTVPEKPAKIEFDSVYFSYGDDDEYVLKNVTFSISRGEKVILMGKSGAGKSTILKLILGLYLPGKGDIRISGMPISEIDILKFRRRTSFLKQEPLLLEGNIQDNICLFKQKEPNHEAQLKESMKMANIYELVESLPEGLKTKIERFGNNFSVGEKQRIVLSSAFYRSADLIIFDEPTSAIDLEGTEKIIDSINKIPDNRTVIISTHNSRLVQCGDRLIKIDNGEIIEDIFLRKRKKEIYLIDKINQDNVKEVKT